jgi:hypothetical protein
MNRYLKTKYDHLVLLAIAVGVGAISLMVLYAWVINRISGRECYNTPIPFLIGGCLAFFILLAMGLCHERISELKKQARCCMVVTDRRPRERKKHMLRIIVITACLAPLPVGPEGTLMPAALGFFFPPLFFVFPQGILLTALAATAFSIGFDRVKFILMPRKMASAEPPTGGDGIPPPQS